MPRVRTDVFRSARAERSVPSISLTAALCMAMSACGSFSPTAVSARFDCVGGAVHPVLLPRPDPQAVHPRGLALQIESRLADEDPGLAPSLASALRSVSLRNYESMRGVDDKEPHFEIRITEMDESAGFEPDEVAGVIMALSGAGTGAVLPRSNPWFGIGASMFRGDSGGSPARGQRRTAFVYQVEFRQKTQAGCQPCLLDCADRVETRQPSDDDVMIRAAKRIRQRVETLDFDPQSSTAKTVRHFGILVDGGLLSSAEARRAEARRILVECVPAWLMGGPVGAP